MHFIKLYKLLARAEVSRLGRLILTLSVIVFLFVRAYTHWPSLTSRAEFWAESGSNFFCNARNPLNFGSLIATDAGYLAFVPRIAALFAVKGLGAAYWAPWIFQQLTFIYIGICGSILIWGSREFFGNVWLRLWLALILVTHWSFGMYVFNNMSYYGVVFAAVIPLLPRQTLGKYFLFFCITLPIVLLNKPYFIAFFPVYAALILVYSVQRNWRLASIFVCSCLALLFQVMTTLANKGTFHTEAVAPSEISTSLISGLIFFFHAFGDVFFGKILADVNFWTRVVSIAIILAFVIFCLARAFTQHKYTPLIAALGLFATAYACEVMTSLVFFQKGYSVTAVPRFGDDSHHFFGMTLILLGVFVAVKSTFRSEWIPMILLAVVTTWSSVFAHWYSKDPVVNRSPRETVWQEQFQKLDTHEKIETNPDGWLMWCTQ